MKITLACVGKLKEKYLVAGVEEFTKRLGPFCKL
ncbi:MAG: 23S rRNA (pseudouridine(1915)-N(3))-methyltransferase RlmH, partial [Acidaminococcaceae bacterium]